MTLVATIPHVHCGRLILLQWTVLYSLSTRFDRDRFPESKRELDALMTDDSLADVPILVLGNKIDVPQAASEEELRAVTGLRETYGKSGSGSQTSGRPLEVFMCSVLRGQGFKDGFSSGWHNFYKEEKRYKRTRRTLFSLGLFRRLESHAARTVRMLPTGTWCWVACFLDLCCLCFC